MGAEIIEVVDLIQFAEKGTLPVAGGILDQTTSFRDAMRAWRSELAAVKAQQTNG